MSVALGAGSALLLTALRAHAGGRSFLMGRMTIVIGMLVQANRLVLRPRGLKVIAFLSIAVDVMLVWVRVGREVEVRV